MSEHRATIRWLNPDGAMEHDRFSRDFTVSLKDGRLTLPGSAAPAYHGNPGAADPEDLLVASLSGCHMLTFLVIAAKRRLTVASYEDEAIGTLEPNAEGKLAVTRVLLQPAVRFSGTVPSAADLAKMHEKAHSNCFIGNSVRTVVTVKPRPSVD